MGTTAYSQEQRRGGPLRLAPPALLSDEALAGRVRAGDERAFEVLYGRYRDRLYRYCASILRQPEDAEEALQSTMLGAYRSLVGSDERELAVRAWLYRIAHNQCIDLLRRRPPHAVTALSGTESSPGQGPAERLETADELAQVRQDLLSLPASQRAALVLRELSGLSHDQIADVLDESAAGVKQIIYQARLILSDMAEGRRMDCHEVRRRISDGDGRVLRSRSVGAHLHSCAGCTRFREATLARPSQLAALAPALPLAAAERILEAIRGAAGGLGGCGGGAAMTSAGAASSGALSGVGGGLGAKLAVVAAVSVVGGSIVAVPAAIHRADSSPAARSSSANRSPGGAPTAASSVVAGTAAASAAEPTGGAMTPSVPLGPLTTGSIPAGEGAPAAAPPAGAAPPSSVAPGTPQTPALIRAVGPAARPVAAPTPRSPAGVASGARPASGSSPVSAPGGGGAAAQVPPVPSQAATPPVTTPVSPALPAPAQQADQRTPAPPNPTITAPATADPPTPARGSAP